MTKRLGFFPRLVTLLFVVVCLCVTGVFSTTAYAADDDVSDASFYKMASAASGYLNNLLAEGGVPGGDSGVAGGLMGYCDEADDSGIIEGWIASALSTSSATFSYDALTRLNDGDSTSSSLYVYCRYGYLLQSLGLDSTSNEAADFIRWFIGGTILILYYASVSIPALFSVVIDLLITLNPFQLFAQTGLAPDAASGAFANLMVWMSDMYDSLSSLSWSLSVPLFFFALVVSLLLFRVTDKAKRIKKYLLRIFIIVIGVPICGSLYTTALEGLDACSAAGNATATRVVLSTFCDFEAWAKNQLELDAPDSSTDSNSVYLSSMADGGPSGAAVTYLRRTCYNINRMNHDGAGFNGGNEIVWDVPAYTSSGNSVTDWNSDSMSGSDVTSSSTISDIQQLLSRYMSNAFFYASDWETYAKSNMDFEVISETISKTDSVSDFIDNGGSDLLTSDSVLWGDGERLSSVDGSATDGSYVWFREGGRLSTMAMYNYLSSKFTESSVIVYSNAKAASGFVRESHKAVNLIGDGVLSFLIYLNSVVLLGTSVLMGWFYAFSLIINSLRRSISLILSIPFSLLGSLRSGAKLVTHTCVLILEIVSTIFLYNLVSEMLMLLSEIVEVGFADAITNLDVDSTILFGDLPPAALFTAGPALMSLLLIISILLMVWFTVIALRLRKAVVRGLDDAASDIINKFFEVSSAPPTPDKPGLLASAAGGAAAGAGAALARKALSAGSSDSKRGAVAAQDEEPGGPGGPDEGDDALGDGDDDDGGGGDTAALGDGSEKDEEDEGARLLEGGSLDDDDDPPGLPSGDGGDDGGDGGGGGETLALPSTGGVNGGVYGGINGAMNASAISAASMAAKKVQGNPDRQSHRNGSSGGTGGTDSGTVSGGIGKNGKPLTKDAKSGEKYSGDHTDSKNGTRNPKAAETQNGRGTGNGISAGSKPGKGGPNGQDAGSRGMKPGDNPNGRNGPNGQSMGANGAPDPKGMQAGDEKDRDGQNGINGQSGTNGQPGAGARNPKASDGVSGKNGQNGSGQDGRTGADGHRDAGSGGSDFNDRGLSASDSAKDAARQSEAAAHEAADRDIAALESQLAASATKGVSPAGSAGSGSKGADGAGGAGGKGAGGKGGAAGTNGANGSDKAAVDVGPNGKIAASVSVSDIQKPNGSGPKVAAAAATGTGQDRVAGSHDSSVHVSTGKGSTPGQPTGKQIDSSHGKSNPGQGQDIHDGGGRTVTTAPGSPNSAPSGSIKRPTGVAAASFGNGVGEEAPIRPGSSSESTNGQSSGGDSSVISDGGQPNANTGSGQTVPSGGGRNGRKNTFAREVAQAAAVGAVVGAITHDAGAGANAAYTGVASAGVDQTVSDSGGSQVMQTHDVRAGESVDSPGTGGRTYVHKGANLRLTPKPNGMGSTTVVGRGETAYVMSSGGGSAPAQARVDAPVVTARTAPVIASPTVNSAPQATYAPIVQPVPSRSTDTIQPNVPKILNGTGRQVVNQGRIRMSPIVTSGGGSTGHDSVTGPAPRNDTFESLDTAGQTLEQKYAYAEMLRARIQQHEQQKQQKQIERRQNPVRRKVGKRTRWAKDKSGGKSISLSNKKKLETKADDALNTDFPDIS